MRPNLIEGVFGPGSRFRQSWEMPALALSLLIIGGVIGGTGMLWTEPAPIHNGPTAGSVVNELGDEAQGEYLKRHFKRSNGTFIETVIYYQDGGQGTVKYRPDSTYQTFTRVAKDGTLLSESTYDTAGKLVVAGWEKRPDLTMLWQTETLPDGKLKTVFYWRDGKQPFSVRIRDVKNYTVDMTYYRADGGLWAHQFGPNGSPPQQEEVYQPGDKLLRTVVRPADDRTVVQNFRPDGTLYFVQKWAVSASEYHYSVYLNQTVVYNADGTAPAMTIWYGGWQTPQSITIVQGDGTKVVHRYYQNEARGIEVITEGNITISKSDTGADPNLLTQLDPAFYVREQPAAENPQPIWDAAEKS